MSLRFVLLSCLLVGFAASAQAQNTPPSFRAPGWTEYTAAGTRDWTAITASEDGSKLAAAVNDGKVWTSVNGGVRVFRTIGGRFCIFRYG